MSDDNKSDDDDDDVSKTMHTFEDVLERVGTQGTYNTIVFFMCAAVGFLTPMQILSSGFLGKDPGHWCRVDELIQANWTQQQIKNLATPDNQTCTVMNYNYTLAAELGYDAVMADPSQLMVANGTVACSARMFNPGANTIVTEWDLVCDRLPWFSTTVAAAQIGMFIGSLLFGYLLDCLGRRSVMLVGIFLFLPFGLGIALSVNVYMYAIFRVAICAVGMGSYLGGFVLSMELCTPHQRSKVSSFYSIPWAVGYMVTAIIAYFVQNWRYLQTAYTLPSVLLFVNYFIVPESPRWLAKRGRYEESLQVLKKMADRNKRSLPSDEIMIQTLIRISPKADKNKGPVSVFSWIRTWIKPQLKLITPIVFYGWFAVAIVYYGVSQGASSFGLNEYVFIMVGGVLEIVAYAATYPALNYIGGRNCLVTSFTIAAVCLLGIMVMQITDYQNEVLLGLQSYLGKFMITAAFHLMYIVTGEMYPTTLRSLIIGESSVCARIGSISSPYINYQLGSKLKWGPSFLFGFFSMIAGGLCLLLPQTTNRALDNEDDSDDASQETDTSQTPEADASIESTVSQMGSICSIRNILNRSRGFARIPTGDY